MVSRRKTKKAVHSRAASRKTSSGITAYRIGDSRFPLFDGRGALLKGARWHSPGRPAIYAALTQACAMLEILAYANTGKVPKHHKLMTIDIPSTVVVEQIDLSHVPGWDDRNYQKSRLYGDQWLTEQRSVALIVPSVIASYDHNIVINPLHPDISKLTISCPEDIHWDERLFR